MISFQEYLILVNQTFNSFNWRYGQSIMNVLHSTNPKIYKELVSSGLDCYYTDSLVEQSLKAIEKNWNPKI